MRHAISSTPIHDRSTYADDLEILGAAIADDNIRRFRVSLQRQHRRNWPVIIIILAVVAMGILGGAAIVSAMTTHNAERVEALDT